MNVECWTSYVIDCIWIIFKEFPNAANRKWLSNFYFINCASQTKWAESRYNEYHLTLSTSML